MAISPCNTTTDVYQRELLEHGSLFFPIACYADNLMVDSVPWHWHDEFEYAIAWAGEPVFYVEKTCVQLQPGDAIFINAGVLHAADSLVATKTDLHSAVFHPRLISASQDTVFWEKLVAPLLKDSAFRYVVLKADTPWQQKVLEEFHAAWNTVADEPDDYENMVRFHLSSALRLLVCNSPILSQPLSEQERIDAQRMRIMLEYIHENYTDELTIQKIAQTANVSESVCLRCFHQIMGNTPIQYIKKLRLEKAAQMLRSTSMTAKEVALTCGFNDVSYFTKAFKEKTGYTPKAYQNLR